MVKKWIKVLAIAGVLLVALIASLVGLFDGPGAMILPFSLPFLLVLLLVYSGQKRRIKKEKAPAQNEIESINGVN